MSFTLRREAARAVVLSRDDHVLLLRARDPADPRKGEWWEIPGGGMDPFESSADAARREIHEETGLHAVELGPRVATQKAEFTFSGLHFDQFEHIHVAWADDRHTATRAAGLEALEALAFQGHRWWPIDEVLDDVSIVLLPHRLRELLVVLRGGATPADPLDLTHTGPWPGS
jgi:8-oxo-dGTP pyrophosphatase MutT (NUDIX family)